MGSLQPYLEIRPGLLNGVELNEQMRGNLWTIVDYVREMIAFEMYEFAWERDEEIMDWKLHFELGEEIDLPEDVNERFERIKSEERPPSAVNVLVLVISPVSSPFSHTNCLTRGSIAFAQISIEDLIKLPRDMTEVTGPILHELLHLLLVPHTNRGVMLDGKVVEEYPFTRTLSNVETAILSHHPVINNIERVTVESPIIATRPDANTVVLSANAIYCVVVRNTVAEKIIDWEGMDDKERRVSRLNEDDHLIVCSQFNVRCFVINSIPIVNV